MDFVQILPEGVSVAAVVFTVILFLKAQSKLVDSHEKTIKIITDTYLETIRRLGRGEG